MLALAARWPLLSFFALACAFSWWPWPLSLRGAAPVAIFGAGPFLAVTVAELRGGRAELLGLLRRMVHWRVGGRWYLVALVLPVILTGLAAALNLLLGAQTVEPLEGRRLLDLLPSFALVLLVPGLGGAWEEPGWRGFALPGLQTRHVPLTASLLLGVAGVLWHLPLFVGGEIAAGDTLLILAAYVVLTWLYNSTGGSVLLLMLCHAANNTVSGGFVSGLFAGADQARQSWLLAAVWSAFALFLIASSGPDRLSAGGVERWEAPSRQAQPSG